MLVLESPDLPAGWSVNEVTADPGSVADDADGTAIDVYRRSRDTGEWPYFPGLSGREGERARARLIPYHQWANRGPGTMRAWLPLAGPGRGTKRLAAETGGKLGLEPASPGEKPAGGRGR